MSRDLLMSVKLELELKAEPERRQQPRPIDGHDPIRVDGILRIGEPDRVLPVQYVLNIQIDHPVPSRIAEPALGAHVQSDVPLPVIA